MSLAEVLSDDLMTTARTHMHVVADEHELDYLELLAGTRL
jgi:hypothetical protein